MCQVADIHLCLPINRKLCVSIWYYVTFLRLAAHYELCLKIFFLYSYANAHVGLSNTHRCQSSWHIWKYFLLTSALRANKEHIVMISPAPYSQKPFLFKILNKNSIYDDTFCRHKLHFHYADSSFLSYEMCRGRLCVSI